MARTNAAKFWLNRNFGVGGARWHTHNAECYLSPDSPWYPEFWKIVDHPVCQYSDLPQSAAPDEARTSRVGPEPRSVLRRQAIQRNEEPPEF